MQPQSNTGVAPDAPPINTKGDREIIGRLRKALGYQRELPAFSRGQMYYDFERGKVRIADMQALGML